MAIGNSKASINRRLLLNQQRIKVQETISRLTSLTKMPQAQQSHRVKPTLSLSGPNLLRRYSCPELTNCLHWMKLIWMHSLSSEQTRPAATFLVVHELSWCSTI